MTAGESNMDENARLSDLPGVPLSQLDLRDQPKPPKVYPRLNWRLRLAMWLMLIGGPFVICMGLYEQYRVSQLRTVGQKVDGKLFDSNSLNTGNGRTSYHLTVDYRPPASDTMYRKDFTVDETTFQQVKEAGTCMVTYLPSDPTVSGIGDNVKADSEPLAIGGGLLAIAGVIWLYFRKQTQDVEKFLSVPASVNARPS
jgi:Protein of unknown function (DUF3592)